MTKLAGKVAIVTGAARGMGLAHARTLAREGARVIGWGWFNLSTILDDYSRCILAWKLRTTMAASDVTETLEMALGASGLDSVRVCHKPRLLSDNGPSNVAKDLAEWLEERGMTHPADVYAGRGVAVLDQRRRITLKTLAARRRLHRQIIAA